MKLRIFEPNKEAKAYIYQQINALAPLVAQPGAVVVVPRVLDGREPRYLIVMNAQVEGETIRTCGRSKSIYEAVSLASVRMQFILEALQSAFGNQTRTSPVQDFVLLH